MSARLQDAAAFSPQERRAASGRVPAPIHHGLDALAGFYGSEGEALAVVQHLIQVHGLEQQQLALLAPKEAFWLRFVRRASQWNRRPHQRDHWRAGPIGIAAIVGAVVGAAAANSGLWPDELTYGIAPEALLDTLAAMIGAMSGASLAGLLHRQQPQYKTFDRLLRRKLREGCWVVLVHDLRWTQQARVVELVSRQGLNWTAVSSAAQG